MGGSGGGKGFVGSGGCKLMLLIMHRDAFFLSAGVLGILVCGGGRCFMPTLCIKDGRSHYYNDTIGRIFFSW